MNVINGHSLTIESEIIKIIKQTNGNNTLTKDGEDTSVSITHG